MKVIGLTKGWVAWVDDEDFDLVNHYKWYARIGKAGKAYAYRIEKRKSMNMHRIIMGAKGDEIVDHRNHLALERVVDNRRENLRIVAHIQNCYNTDGRARKYSRYKGVTYSQYGANRWVAQIAVDKRYHYLGRFPCETAAAIAYDKASLRLHGEFGRRNILKEIPNA